MSQTKSVKKIYALTITERNGVSEELKTGFLEYMEKQPYHLLSQEGGKDSGTHFHLHAIVGSNYGTSSNFRKKDMKKLYKSIGRIESFTKIGLVIKTTTESSLAGALSYAMKDTEVLTSNGIDLKTIEPWVNVTKTKESGRLKSFRQITCRNFVSEVCLFIDKNSVRHPDSRNDIRNIITQMMGRKYLFTFDNRTKSLIGKVLQVYGHTAYSMAHFDQLTAEYQDVNNHRSN